MKQPGLEALRLSLYESDPLEIVKAFYTFNQTAIAKHGIKYVLEHRLYCLAELIVSEMHNQFMSGRGSRLSELAKQQAEIEQLRAAVLFFAKYYDGPPDNMLSVAERELFQVPELLRPDTEKE